MRSVGIIAEYNPFHKGHEYQLSKARELSGADAVITCMSGDWVQRGLPGCADKWTRAKWALDGGADLVVELPAYFALSDAGGFARGGAMTLGHLGVDAISFGSENGDSSVLKLVSKRIGQLDEDICMICKEDPSKSYPSVRQEAYLRRYRDSNTIDKEINILSSSNDILAIEYLKYLGDIDIFPIMRLGGGYNSGYLAQNEYQSATAIRELLAEEKAIEPYIPSYVSGYSDINHLMNEYFKLSQYRILSMEAEDIDKMPSGGEGLGARLKDAILSSETIDELILKTKSKKHTYTRISRLIAQLLLGIERNTFNEKPMYIRVLGFNDIGRQVLSDAKKNSGIPIVTNLGKSLGQMNEEEIKMLKLDIHASNVYNVMARKNIADESDYYKKPIIK